MSTPRRRADAWLRLAALVLLAGVLYGNTLQNGFVWDDRLTAAAPVDVHRVLVERTGTFYRPVVMLSFAVDRAVWRGSPVGFHLTNVVAHVAVAWLLGALVEALGLDAGVALVSSLVFFAHPVQTEAVTYISGRTDILCALFVLVGFLAWRRVARPFDGWAMITAAAFIAALLCKETAVALPLGLIMPCAHPATRSPRPFLPIAVSAAWLVATMRSGGPSLQLGSLVGRLPAIGVAALSYMRLLVWPSDLHLERFTAIGTRPDVAIAAWAVVIAVGISLVGLARRIPGGLFLLAVAVLAYLPGSGIVPVYPAIADRALFMPEHFLYLPLLGLCPLVVGGLASLWPQRARRAIPAVVCAVLLAWGLVVIHRNADWRDEETIFRHTIAYEPPTSRVWFNLANLALVAGRLDEAQRLYEAALARTPGDGEARLNLAITLQRMGRLEQAEAQYRAALESDPRLAEAYRGLAQVLVARGAIPEAMELLRSMPTGAP